MDLIPFISPGSQLHTCALFIYFQRSLTQINCQEGPTRSARRANPRVICERLWSFFYQYAVTAKLLLPVCVTLLVELLTDLFGLDTRLNYLSLSHHPVIIITYSIRLSPHYVVYVLLFPSVQPHKGHIFLLSVCIIRSWPVFANYRFIYSPVVDIIISSSTTLSPISIESFFVAFVVVGGATAVMLFCHFRISYIRNRVYLQRIGLVL